MDSTTNLEGTAAPAPVRRATTVRSDLAHTFDTFVATIGRWWPVQPFSRGGDRVRDVVVERHLGGRVHEVWEDGTESDWGVLLAWDPPHRFVMTWNHTEASSTEVELTFRALGPSLTRVSVEHRGWERLTPEQLRRDCALPGGYSTGSYAVGWERILGAFAGSLGGAA